MFLKVNHNRIKALIYSLSLATLLAACVNSNNAGGSSQQYLTVSSQKTAVLGLQSLITDENSTLRDVAKGNGIYVVVGDNGAIIRSNDGINWQPQNGVVSENLSGITYNTVNKLFYAVGDAGLIISSPDGVNWTEYKRLTPAVKLNSIMSVKGDEIIAGESGNVFEVAVTSKRGMVVVQGLDDGSNSTSTAFNGDETMLIGTANGDLYYKAYSSSFSTANWSRTKTFTNMPISDISYNALNSSITATTLNGYVTKSTDGKTWSVATSIDPLNTSINLNSITVEPWTNRYLVVGGDSQQNELVRFSSDFNQWAKGSLSANYQLQKVRCFDENSCVAVGDNTTVVVASKKADSSGMDWKLIDLSKPSVKLESPLNGATNTSTQPVIKLDFNKYVNNVNSDTISLREGSVSGANVIISQITASGNDFVFSPLVKLKESTKYIIAISDGITDDHENKIPATTFSFTTGDFTAPTALMTYPINGGVNMPTKPMILMDFSETVKNINTSNLTLREGSKSGTIVAIDKITPAANNRYMFTPTVALKDKTKYFVVASNGITDLQTNKMIESSFSFTTGDFTAPSVSILYPGNNETNVLTSAAVKIMFSESVTNVTINTVAIRPGSITGTPITIASIVAQNNNTYTIIPADGTLKTSTRYYVTFGAIQDLSKNNLISSQFSFTTVPPVVQKITFSPVKATAGVDFNLVMNTTVIESVQLNLQWPFYSAIDNTNKVTCNSGLTCNVALKTRDRYQTPGSYLVQAVGLNSGVTAQTLIQLSGPESNNYIAVQDNKSYKIMACYLDGSLNASGCKLGNGGFNSGIFISPGSTLFTYVSADIKHCLFAGATTGSNYDLTIDGCLEVDRPGNIASYSVTGAAFSVNSKYFYSHYSYGYGASMVSNTYICDVVNDVPGAPARSVYDDCVVVPGLPASATDLVLNYNGDRLLANTANGVIACVVDKATGAIKSCVNNTSGGKSMTYLTLSPDNKRTYTVKDKSITECDYDSTTNKLSGCVTTSYSMTIGGLAFSEGKAILGDSITGKLSKCSIATDGTIGTCSGITGIPSLITSMSGLAVLK